MNKVINCGMTNCEYITKWGTCKLATLYVVNKNGVPRCQSYTMKKDAKKVEKISQKSY